MALRLNIKNTAIFTFLILSGALTYWKYKPEAIRVTSPDGKWDAVLIHSWVNGISSSPNSHVLIVAKGQQAEFPPQPYHQYQLVLGSKIAGEKLIWGKPNHLEVHYTQGEVYYITNPWFPKPILD